MRLLIVSQYFWPEEFRVNDLVVGMRSRGHEVTVLTGQPNYPGGVIFDAYREDRKAFNTYAGASIVRSPIVPRGKRGALRLALNYLSFALSASTLGVWCLRKRQFDAVIVFQTSPVTAAIPALILKWLKPAPVFLWVQDLWPDTLSAIGAVRSPGALSLLSALVKFIYSGCDRILIQSRAFDARVRRLARAGARVDYFPNWSEPTLSLGLENVAPASELNSPEPTFKVMFAGNIGEAQDLPAVLDAVELCRDLPLLRWLIVGDGRARSALQSEVLRRGLSDQILFLGRYPPRRMPSFFKSADALLVSLKGEPIWSMTIPSKVQSYLAAGRPVLGMIDGEGARVIEESGGGLVSKAGDGAALAENVRKLIAMPKGQLAAMGRAGRSYAAEHFDREKLLDELEGWLNDASSEFKLGPKGD